MTADLFTSHVGGKGKNSTPRCYTKHKPLKFGKGILVGASCGSPREGYDIYIGFDWGMEFNHDVYPWETDNDPVIEFQFRVSDMCAPKSPKKFKAMITWVCSQLHNGKKIHVGCIGGHGRTGLFIAAVRAEFDGDKDAGNWVRKHHCKKAIESKSQINFLFKHYGIKKIKASKTEYKGWVEKGKSKKFAKYTGGNGNVSYLPRNMPDTKITYLSRKGSIWG